MTLKVFRWKDGYITCDDRHHYGGICMKQRALFKHIAPNGFVDFMDVEEFYLLARAHGWEVIMEQKKENFDDEPI